MNYIQQILKTASLTRLAGGGAVGGISMIQKLFLIAILFIAGTTLSAQRIYVKPDGTGDGTSWKNALAGTKLQGKIINGASGTEIWVAKGTYSLAEQENTEHPHFTIAGGVKVYGGFAGTETSLDQREKIAGGKAWEFVNETIFQQTRRDVNNARVLYIYSGSADKRSLLDGVTVTGGYIKLVQAGAGICFSGENVTVENCIVKGNISDGSAAENGDYGRGGGVLMNGGTLRNSLITENTSKKTGYHAGYGAGVCVTGPKSVVENCTISKNVLNSGNDGGSAANGSTGAAGGGICVYWGATNTAITDCEIRENEINMNGNYGANASSGAGIYVAAPTTIKNTLIESNVISGNGANLSSNYYGAGIFIVADAQVSDCVIRGNTSVVRAGGVGIRGGTSTFTNTQITGNVAQNNNAGVVCAGGGVQVDGGTVTFDLCDIKDNITSNRGGAVAISSGTATIKRTFIQGNVANFNAGGLIVSAGALTAENCVVSNNYLGTQASADNTKWGGGGFQLSNGTLDVKNCTIVNNHCGTGSGESGGGFKINGGTASLFNTVIWGNVSGATKSQISGPVTLTNCAVESLAAAGTNIQLDPANTNTTGPNFESVSNSGRDPSYANANWKITGVSPLLFAGTAAGAPATDISGKPRIGAPSIGAYEFEVPEAFYVTVAGKGDRDGSDWDNAASGTAGIIAGFGSRARNIYIGKGTYTSNQGVTTATTGAYNVPAGVTIYGGYPEDGGFVRDVVGNETILNTTSQGARVIYVAGGNVTLDGLTISGGSPNGTGPGGGLHVAGVNFTLRNCVVKDNNQTTTLDGTGGGGLFLSGANAKIINSKFIKNIATTNTNNLQGGGALFVNGEGLIIEKSEFSDNSASSSGGAIYLNKAATIKNCKITSNKVSTGTTWGGGIFLSSGIDATTLVENSIIANNASSGGNGYGAGIGCNAQQSRLDVINTVIANNYAKTYGAAYASGSGLTTATRVRFINCTVVRNKTDAATNCAAIQPASGHGTTYINTLVWGNAGGRAEQLVGGTNASITACAADGPNVAGAITLAENPFVSPTEAAGVDPTGDVTWQTADWHLLGTAPCIDAGIGGGGVPAYDIAGVLRPQYFGEDIGAYEFDGQRQAAAFYVDGRVASSGDGTTWGNAFKTLEEGITAATGTSKPLLIAVGRYNISASIKFTTGKSIKMYGGFNGGESNPLARKKVKGGKPWEFVYETIIDRGATSAAANGQVFVINTPDVSMDGLTITGGFMNSYGGAIELKNAGSKATVTNCKITNNKATNSGGAVVFYSDIGAKSFFTNCLFDGNTTTVDGGAISIHGQGGQEFTGCQFSNNSANKGGAIHLNQAAMFKNCVIVNNTASANAGATGGGIYAAGGVSTFENTLVANNANPNGNSWGAGFAGEGDNPDKSRMKFTNCTIVNNRSGATEATRTGGQGAVLVNCVLFYNGNGPTTPTNSQYYACDLTSCLVPANTSKNLFINPSQTIGISNDALTADWRLLYGSPLIDAGTATGAPATDITGALRPIGAGYDIGIYEMDYTTPVQSKNNRIYVSKEGAGEKTGAGWENALPEYRLINALTAMGTNAELWLMAGTYTLAGSEFALSAGKKIYGGFNGTETSITERTLVDRNGDKSINAWEFENETIMRKPNSSGPLFTLENGAKVNGVTFKDVSHASDGLVQMKSGTSGAVIEACEFRGLTGANGGAVSAGNADHIIRSSLFISNISTGKGGALYVAGTAGTILIEKSIFTGNKTNADNQGGAIYIAQPGTKLVNCLVSNNSNGGTGTVSTTQAENCEIVNCTIVKNQRAGGSWGVGIAASATTHVKNSVIWGNENNTNQVMNVMGGNYTHCAIGVNGTGDSGAIIAESDSEITHTGNPLDFIQPASSIGVSEGEVNWHITNSSSLRAKGIAVGGLIPADDLDGELRSRHAPSIGAYEGRGKSKTVSNANDLKNASDVGVSYILGADISIDAGYEPSEFNGFLVGNGHKISINGPITAGGLFSKIGSGALFENLLIEVNANISNTDGSAGVFAPVTTGLVTFKDVDVQLYAELTSNNGDCGGLIGIAMGEIVVDNVLVQVGNSQGTSSGMINALGSTEQRAGGLFGCLESLKFKITSSRVNVGSQGTIQSKSSGERYVGGFIGAVNSTSQANEKTIESSSVFIDGVVGQDDKGTGSSYVAGFIGNAQTLSINKSLVYLSKTGKILISEEENDTATANYGGICGNGSFIGDNVFYIRGNLLSPAKALKIGDAKNAYLIPVLDSIRVAGRIPFVKTSDGTTYASSFDYNIISLPNNAYVEYDRAFLIAKQGATQQFDFTFNMGGRAPIICPIELNVTLYTGDLIYYVRAGATQPDATELIVAETYDPQTNVEPYGTTWNRPYAGVHLQRALDKASLNGGQVWVQENGDNSFNAASQIDKIENRGEILGRAFVVPAGVAVYGGFRGTERVLSERIKTSQADFIFEKTILTANYSGTGGGAKDYDRVVFLEFGGSIDGFTIQNGVIGSGYKGAGIYASALTTIKNMHITGNTATASGAGVLLESGARVTTVLVEKNKMTANTAGQGYGAGICVEGSDVVIEKSTIKDNEITTTADVNSCYGAGIVTMSDSVLITNCDITGNKIIAPSNGSNGVRGAGISALNTVTITKCNIFNNEAGNSTLSTMPRGFGGGIYVIGKSSYIADNKIYMNYAGSRGGGIYAGRDGTSSGADDILMYNNIVAHNHAQTDEGGGLYVSGTQPTKIINCSFLKNSAQRSEIASVRGGGTATEFINSIAWRGYNGGVTRQAKTNLYGVTAYNSIYYGKESVTAPTGSENYELTEIENTTLGNFLNFEKPSSYDGSNVALSVANIENIKQASWLHRDGVCFDKGRTVTNVPAVDIRGDKRPEGSAWDIGAYEYKPVLILSKFTVTPTSSGADIRLVGTLEQKNPMPVPVKIKLLWSGAVSYMQSLPDTLEIPSGAIDGSLSIKLNYIDKPAEVVLAIDNYGSESSIAANVAKTYKILLTTPVFTSNYTVELDIAKASYTEGDVGQITGRLIRPDGSTQPPARIGISLKTEFASDASSFEFGTGKNDDILWFNYGEEVSNTVQFKIIPKLGQQFNGLAGRYVGFVKGGDYSQGHLSLASKKDVQVFDISDNFISKVNARLEPIADAFTNETTRITVTLDAKLNSTIPLDFDLRFSPETLGVSNATLSIKPNETTGSYLLTIPAILPRTTFTVTATPKASQSLWVTSVSPSMRSFKAGNSIIYVNGSNISGITDGKSFATGFTTIDMALSTCDPTGKDGEEIRVARGTYAVDKTIKLAGKMIFRGGFNPTATDSTPRATGNYPWDMIDSTIIIFGNAANVTNFAISAAGKSVVDGFTIKNTGGIELADSTRFVNNIVKDNVLHGSTGAISVTSSASLVNIERSLIFNNKVSLTNLAAGAIRSFAPAYTNLFVRNSMIANNHAEQGAGASYGQITFENCLVAHNSVANKSTAGASAFGPGARIMGSTVVKNRGGSYASIGHTSIINSIFWNNLDHMGAAKQTSSFDGCSYSAFEGSTFNALAGSYLVSLWSENTGIPVTSSELPPDFVSPSTAAAGNISNATIASLGNWRLKSKLSNMGTNTPYNTPVSAYDLDQTQRIKKEIVDLGCYESSINGSLVVTLDLTKADTVYFGEAVSVKYTVAFPMEGRTIAFKFKNLKGEKFDKAIDAGTYTIEATDPAFDITLSYVNEKNEFTITPLPINVTMDNKVMVINSVEGPKLSFTPSVPLFARDIPTMNEKIVIPKLPANYNPKIEAEWVVTGEKVAGNYNVGTITNGKLKVIKQVIKPENIIWVYPDGESAGSILTYNGKVRLCSIRFVGDMQATPNRNDYTITHSVTSPKEPGSYTAWLTFKDDAAFVTEGQNFLTSFTINPMQIELDMSTPTYKTYGSPDPAFSYRTVPAMCAGDSLILTKTRVEGEDVRPEGYQFSTANWYHPSYRITKYQDGVLMINKANLTVSPNETEIPVAEPVDPKSFVTTITGLKHKDSLDQVYGVGVRPECVPDPNYPPTAGVSVGLYVVPATLQPNGVKGKNYTAIANSGIVTYKATSNQTLTFTLPSSIEYGQTITLKATSNRDTDVRNLPITYSATSSNVQIIGDKLTALGVMDNVEITAHQAGNQALGIDAASATAMINFSKRILTINAPVETVTYNGAEQLYSKEVTVSNYLERDETLFSYTVAPLRAKEPHEVPYSVEVSLSALTDMYAFKNGQSTISLPVLKINKKALNFEQIRPITSVVYNGQLQSCDTTAFKLIDNQIVLGDDVPSLIYYNKAINKGDNDVRIEVDTNMYYTTGTARTLNGVTTANGVFVGVFRITPAQLIVDFAKSTYSMRFGTKLPVLDTEAFVFSGFIGADTIKILPSYTTTATSTSPVNTYPMTLDTRRVEYYNTQKGNYVIMSRVPTATLNISLSAISKADYVITGEQNVFDGRKKGITVAFKPGVFDTFNPATDATITYKLGGIETDPKNPGTYEYSIKITKPGITGETSYDSKLIIARAPLKVTYGNLHQIYDGAPKMVTTQIAPTTSTDIFFATYQSQASFTTTYNASTTVPTEIGSYAVRTIISPTDKYYTLDARATMTITRAESVPVGFASSNVLEVREPAPGEEITVPVIIKSLNGLPVRSGASLSINVVTTMATTNYVVPTTVAFVDSQTVTFNVKINNNNPNIVYNDQELLLTLATIDPEVRVDVPNQYRLRILNTDKPTPTGNAKFASASVIGVEGERVFASIITNAGGGSVELIVTTTSRYENYKVFTKSGTLTPINKKITVDLSATGTTTLGVELGRSYEASTEKPTIKLKISKLTFANGLQGSIDRDFSTFAILVNNNNPFVDPVDLTSDISEDSVVNFDILAFVKDPGTLNPAYSIRLGRDTFVDTILSLKGATISIKNNMVVYNYKAIRSLIKNPELGFEDEFDCVIDNGFGGMTEVAASVSITQNYTVGSVISVKVTDFVNGVPGAGFVKTPKVFGSYFDPFANVKPGKILKSKKAAMRTKLSSDPSTAKTEVTAKVKLVNTSALSKFRKGTFTEMIEGLKVTVAPQMFLDAALNYRGVAVESIGVEAVGQSIYAESSQGDVLGALIITHPKVDTFLRGVDVSSGDQVIVVQGNFFGAKPTGILEYRRADGKIGTIKLSMIKSSNTKAKMITVGGGALYKAPTTNEIKEKATEGSTLIFKYPTKWPSNMNDARIDLLIDSGSGIGGVKKINTLQ